MAAARTLSLLRLSIKSANSGTLERVCVVAPCILLPSVFRQQRNASYYDKFGKVLDESHRNNPRNMEEVEEMGMTKMLKKNRMYAQYNYQEWRYPRKERPIDISCTRFILKEYEMKDPLMTRLREPRKEFESRRMEILSHRFIKKHVRSFHRKRFPIEAQEIYIKAHELLNTENWTISKKEETEESLHGLVTEFAYPKMLEGLDTKTVNWKFVELIEPPRTVQVLVAPMVNDDNMYGQVTVRFHTKQILAIYDRFGRLMMGSPTEPREILEYVTFERHVVDQYGKWRIHAKKISENINLDNTDKTVAIIRKKPERIEAEEWQKSEDDITPYKWYPARERIIAKLNRPFTVYRNKQQRKKLRKWWVLNVLRRPKLRMKRQQLRKVAVKSKLVYEMRQRGELPKPPP